jgi:uncharacterized protein YndB with AHSA1/START domain
MESRMQQGYLVLADISGFTSYLAGVELEHAHEILSDLLETIVDSFKPVLLLSKLEGDAVFAYAADSRLPRGETLLEILEVTYVAFRSRLEAIRRRTTCQCKACRSIPMLDLKFMAHHGEYILQSVAGNTEVIGSDVNLAHRLMKNGVGEATDWRAYVLFTHACLTQMGIWPDCLYESVESYEHLGDIQTYSLDLHKRYKELVEARRVEISLDESYYTLIQDLAAPPAVVWSWLNDPHKRELWIAHSRWTVSARPGGRTGTGTRNHCAHGKQESTEEILDWRPFEYFSCQDDMGMKGRMILYSTYRLLPLEGNAGTRLQLTCTLKIGRLPAWIARPACRLFMNRMANMPAHAAHLASLIAEDGAVAPAPAFMPALAAS